MNYMEKEKTTGAYEKAELYRKVQVTLGNMYSKLNQESQSDKLRDEMFHALERINRDCGCPEHKYQK